MNGAQSNDAGPTKRFQYGRLSVGQERHILQSWQAVTTYNGVKFVLDIPCHLRVVHHVDQTPLQSVLDSLHAGGKQVAWEQTCNYCENNFKRAW